MSDNENEQIAFRNADTLHRRAWIDRALSGVRGRLQPDGDGPTPASGVLTVTLRSEGSTDS